MRPVGYAFLQEHYELSLPKLDCEYFQGDHAKGIKTINYGASIRKVLCNRTKIGNTPFDHIKTAINYQGIRLQYLYVIFKTIDEKDLIQQILKTPTSKQARVVWFLYEWLMETKLAIPDLKTGNYVNLFDSKYYFTRESGVRCQRTRVNNNALGTSAFCPCIRKTHKVIDLLQVDVYETAFAQMQEMGILLNADVVDRCINYLYTKESKTSSAIERETPSKQRLKRFNQALKNAGLYNLNKHSLLSVQNQIVDQKARVDDYRKEEIYVGETKYKGAFIDEDIHFVGPKAEHVENMMEGLLVTHDNLMTDCNMPALMHAAVISFGLVYIHPFDDGNGRTHRYLLHDVFKQRDKRHEFIIPISATILKSEKAYDTILNTISAPLLLLLDYEIDSDNENRVVIHNDLHYMYRYPDFTPHVEYIYEMMDTSIKLELMSEVVYLTTFDAIKKVMNQNADVSANHANTIINIIINNGGNASKNKRQYILEHISEEVLGLVEASAQQVFEAMKNISGVDIENLQFE
jgi:hypothetical protein